MELDVRHIDLSMGEGKRARTVLGDVSFSVPDGAFCSLLGESGAGKSTILKVIAGILLQDGGSVLFDGAPVDGLPRASSRHRLRIPGCAAVPPYDGRGERRLSAAHGRCGQARAPRPRRASCWSACSCLASARAGCRRFPAVRRSAWRWPALLRRRPRPWLLDEPFSGLDESLRDDMRSLLLRLHREDGLTVLMVTHDANEAIMMSNRIVALDGGHISQIGTPEELYRRPATAKIAACFGDCSVLKGCVESERFILDGIVLPALGIGDRAGCGRGAPRRLLA